MPGAGRQSRLAAEAAHDLNNLLAVIGTAAIELQRTQHGEQREWIGEILAATERGKQLGRDLIAASRPPLSGGGPSDVNGSVLDCAALLERILGEEIELRIEPASGLPRVLLAPELIERILVNLAINAREAMPVPGTVTVRTQLRAVEAGDPRLGIGWHVEVALIDEGVGMADAVSARALDPYFTTRAEAGGSGLGLPAIADIARAADGDVRIESTPGEGTCVAVLLPAVRSNGDRLALGGPGSDRGRGR
jgi:signal transduction histidine kinase